MYSMKSTFYTFQRNANFEQDSLHLFSDVKGCSWPMCVNLSSLKSENRTVVSSTLSTERQVDSKRCQVGEKRKKI